MKSTVVQTKPLRTPTDGPGEEETSGEDEEVATGLKNGNYSEVTLQVVDSVHHPRTGEDLCRTLFTTHC